jgi:hypothetical protein
MLTKKQIFSLLSLYARAELDAVLSAYEKQLAENENADLPKTYIDLFNSGLKINLHRLKLNALKAARNRLNNPI